MGSGLAETRRQGDAETRSGFCVRCETFSVLPNHCDGCGGALTFSASPHLPLAASLSDLKPGAHRSNSGDWFFTWNCNTCRDSGLVKELLDPNQCTDCQAFLNPISARVFGAICVLTIKDKPVDEALFALARALVPFTSQEPIQGEALASLLGCSERLIKKYVARLDDEWRVPAIASRKPPYGYFIAANAQELLEWGRVIRSQAVNELARYYHLFKSVHPELAGQESFDFIDTVSTELQEAIR